MVISEFDKFLEEHKERLETLDTKEDITDAELTAQEIEIDEADQEVGTLCLQIDSSSWVDTIDIEWPIVYMEGSWVIISKYCFSNSTGDRN